MIDEIKDYLKARFDRLDELTLIGTKEVLTIDEAALFTGFKKNGLYNLTYQKQIPYYKKSGRVFFRKSELESWMTRHKVRSDEELNGMAATYTALNPLSRRRATGIR